MKLTIFLIILIGIVYGSYTPQIAHKLVVASNIAFSTESEINNWNCQLCAIYSLKNTHFITNSIVNVSLFTGYSVQDNAIIISFRDVANIQNWIATLDATQVTYPGCSGCLIHQGIYTAYSAIESYLRVDVQKLLALYRGAKIWVTGFGVGGAWATIASVDLKQIFTHVQLLMNFGSPRIGNQAFSGYVQAQIPERYRVIVYNDIVPHLPPQIPIPYVHFSNEVWYIDQKMSKYKVCGAEQFQCSKSVLPNNWSTTTHDPKLYLKLPSLSMGNLQIHTTN